MGSRDQNDKAYRDITSKLTEYIWSATYGNLDSLMTDAAITPVEEFVLNQCTIPETCLDYAIKSLRIEFGLDYDDLVLDENYVNSIPAAMVRNTLLSRFVSMSNYILIGCKPRYDATLNSVAGDYVNLAELILFKIEALAEHNGYMLNPEDIPEILLDLTAIDRLISYSWHMLDMSSTMKPVTFKKECFRLKNKLNTIIGMATFGHPHPKIDFMIENISGLIDQIMTDKNLDDLQADRNKRYMESKIRLYNYTIRMTEQLSIQLESCNPLDITHRNDLKKQLETVQHFMRSFDKDR